MRVDVKDSDDALAGNVQSGTTATVHCCKHCLLTLKFNSEYWADTNFEMLFKLKNFWYSYRTGPVFEDTDLRCYEPI